MPRKASDDRNTAIDYLNRDIVNIKTELQHLNKVVRDGNGQPSLMSQVATIKSELHHVEAELKEALHDLKTTMNRCHLETVENSKMPWQFKGAVVVALISSLTSVLLGLYGK